MNKLKRKTQHYMEKNPTYANNANEDKHVANQRELHHCTRDHKILTLENRFFKQLVVLEMSLTSCKWSLQIRHHILNYHF